MRFVVILVAVLSLFVNSISQVMAEDVEVTGRVSARPEDLFVRVETVDSGETHTPGNEVTYRLYYHQQSSFRMAIGVMVTWSFGYIEKTNTEVRAVEYVDGSATNGFNNAVPIVDPLNRTIVWNLGLMFPSTTDNYVDFKLVTNSNFSHEYPALYTVSALMTAPLVESAWNPLNQYLTRAVPPPPPTPTPGPPSEVPVIDKPVAQLAFAPRVSTVSIDEITTTTAHISVGITRPTSATLFYGEEPDNLKNSLRSINPNTDHDFVLQLLKPDTQYYFVVTPKDTTKVPSGNSLYTFRTAKSEVNLEFDTNTLVVTSNKVILSNQKLEHDYEHFQTFVLPKSTRFEFKAGLLNTDANVREVKGFLRRRGANLNAILTEFEPKHFSGVLYTDDVGMYELYAQVADFEGNLKIQKLANVRVIEPLKVMDKSLKNSIEKAAVKIELYNPRLKMFEEVTAQTLGFGEEPQTDINGLLGLVLPLGKYRLVISHPNYISQKIDFKIGAGPDEVLPTIYLEAKQLGIWQQITLFVTTLVAFILTLLKSLTEQLKSHSLFQLFGALLTLALVILTPLSLASRTHIQVWKLPWYFFYHLLLIFTARHTGKYVRGRVIDVESGEALSKVVVELLNVRAMTNKIGEFYIRFDKVGSYVLKCSKYGFEKVEVDVSAPLQRGLDVRLQKIAGHKTGMLRNMILMFDQLFGLMFEFFLLTMLLFITIFIYNFGLNYTWPLGVIWLLNLSVWIFYLKSDPRIMR
jgi:hypothetical protein